MVKISPPGLGSDGYHGACKTLTNRLGYDKLNVKASDVGGLATFSAREGVIIGIDDVVGILEGCTLSPRTARLKEEIRDAW